MYLYATLAAWPAGQMKIVYLRRYVELHPRDRDEQILPVSRSDPR